MDFQPAPGRDPPPARDGRPSNKSRPRAADEASNRVTAPPRRWSGQQLSSGIRHGRWQPPDSPQILRLLYPRLSLRGHYLSKKSLARPLTIIFSWCRASLYNNTLAAESGDFDRGPHQSCEDSGLAGFSAGLEVRLHSDPRIGSLGQVGRLGTTASPSH